MKAPGAAFALIATLAGHALANDTTAVLEAGGLVFVTNDTIRMASEDLYLSMDEVRVVYRFENLTDEDQPVFVAFPMPDMEADYYSPVSYPTEDPDNIFGFSTLFNGEPVEARLHQAAFALGVDRTKELLQAGLPMAPHTMDAAEKVTALSEETKQVLARLGILEFNDWSGEIAHYPAWSLRSSYTWEAVFPAGETVTVEHRYQPGLGGTSSVSFLYEGAPTIRADYDERYCLDDAFVSAVERNIRTPGEPWTAPYYETWLSYILSTGANWAGSIGEFRLVVDKGEARNLVSFCGEGVTKISDTAFEVVYENYAPWSDIDVLFLVRYDLD